MYVIMCLYVKRISPKEGLSVFVPVTFIDNLNFSIIGEIDLTLGNTHYLIRGGLRKKYFD